MTKKQLQRFLALDEMEERSADEEKEYQKLNGLLEDEPEARKEPEIDPDEIVNRILDGMNTPKKEPAKVNGDVDVQVGDSRTPDHKRRTVRYFNALAKSVEDQQAARSMMKDVVKEAQGMNERQIKDEMKEADDIITRHAESLKAKGDRQWKSKAEAIRSQLDIDTRLHTTSTADTAKAGNLLPKPFLAEVFVQIEEFGIVRRLFRNIPMTSKSLDLKNVLSKVVAFWGTEGVNMTDSDMVIDEGQMIAEKLYGLTTWTTELEEDQVLPLLPLAQEQFAESFAEHEDEAGLLGDGTGDFGNVTGIANLTNAEVHTLTGTDSGGFTETDLRTAKNLLSLAGQRGARWVMHKDMKDLIEQFENSAGFRIFQPTISPGAPDLLFGYPIELSEVLPAPADEADTPFMLFGNFGNALFGSRRGITADVSREAVIQHTSGGSEGDIKYNAFQADGAILRLTQRLTMRVPQALESRFVVVQTAAS